MLALRFAATTKGCSISAETCNMNEVGSGACTGDSGLCCSDTPSGRGAAAAAVHSCDFGTPTAAVAQCFNRFLSVCRDTMFTRTVFKVCSTVFEVCAETPCLPDFLRQAIKSSVRRI
jgi:hypothetical protein